MSLFNVVEDHAIPDLSLDEQFIKNRHSTFFFQIKSEAMAPQIMMGDLLIVDRSLPPLPGMIIIASINGEMLCRRLAKQTGKEKYKLEANNPKFPTINISELEEDGVVWGVVKNSIRKLL